MFRANAARELFKDPGQTRWTFDVEVLLRAYAAGYRVGELPVTWTNGATSRVRAGEVIPDMLHLWRLKKKMDKKS